METLLEPKDISYAQHIQELQAVNAQHIQELQAVNAHVQELQALNTEYVKTIQSFEGQIAYLNEQLEWLKKRLFGSKNNQKAPQDEAKTEEVEGYLRKKRSSTGEDTIILPENLRIVEEVIDIPEEDKVCASTGLPLIKIGEQITQKLAYQPGSYYIRKIIRYKYAWPKGSIEEGIHMAELPESLLSRCEADDSFLADIMVKKYADHLPLYRQSEILSRVGIKISRQILAKWIVRTGQALKPLVNIMHKQILASGNIFIDETPIKMLDKGNGKAGRGYMWVLVGGKAANPCNRIYFFKNDRCHSNARDLLGNYQGSMHSDKYGAYEKLGDDEQIVWCPCWSHIRIKFAEAETGDPPFKEWIIGKINRLFDAERIAWTYSEEERLRIRQEEEVPIIDELIEAITRKSTEGALLPKSKFKIALEYFIGLIPFLKNYTKSPWARLDNNPAERTIRPLALGRKNWLFVGNEDSAESAGVILSLIQTCIAAKINPQEYLEDVMRRIMSHSAQRLEELLPFEWAACRA